MAEPTEHHPIKVNNTRLCVSLFVQNLEGVEYFCISVRNE